MDTKNPCIKIENPSFFHDKNTGDVPCAFMMVTKKSEGKWNIHLSFKQLITMDLADKPPLIFYDTPLKEVFDSGMDIEWFLPFVYIVSDDCEEKAIFPNSPPTQSSYYATSSNVYITPMSLPLEKNTVESGICIDIQDSIIHVAVIDAIAQKSIWFELDLCSFADYDFVAKQQRVKTQMTEFFPSLCESTYAFKTFHGCCTAIEGEMTGNKVFTRAGTPPAMVRKFPAFSTKYGWRPVIEEGDYKVPSIDVILSKKTNEFLQIQLQNLLKVSYKPVKMSNFKQKDLLNINLKLETVYGGVERTYNTGKISSKSKQNFICNSPLVEFSAQYSQWLPPIEANHIETVISNLLLDKQQFLFTEKKELTRLRADRVKTLTSYQSIGIPRILR